MVLFAVHWNAEICMFFLFSAGELQNQLFVSSFKKRITLCHENVFVSPVTMRHPSRLLDNHFLTRKADHVSYPNCPTNSETLCCICFHVATLFDSFFLSSFFSTLCLFVLGFEY